MTTTDFLLDPGTSGFIITPFNLQTTELNSLASGSAATSSAGGGGANGKYSQTDFANAIETEVWFISGGSITPTAGACISGWWLKSTDGGTTFESLLSTPSTTVPALPRGPDFIIPLAAAAGTPTSFGSTPFRAPYTSCKVEVQNFTGVALASSGNKILAGPVAWHYN